MTNHNVRRLRCEVRYVEMGDHIWIDTTDQQGFTRRAQYLVTCQDLANGKAILDLTPTDTLRITLPANEIVDLEIPRLGKDEHSQQEKTTG